MTAVLWIFLLFTSLYHVVVTLLVYGLGWLQPEILVIVRDLSWFLIFFVTLVVYRKYFLSYVRRTRKLRVVFIVLSLFSLVISFLQHKTMTDILVGAKYGLQFFVIFLMAIFLGQVFAHRGAVHFSKFLRRIFAIVLGVVIIWLLRQIAKFYIPERFYTFGYTTFGDWMFGQNPPLYYLTGPGWYARLSGIFSWPNNYGYLFVGLFGFWWRYIRTYVKNKAAKFILRLIFAISVLWTLSRGAILGIFLQIIAIAFTLLHTKRNYLIGLFVVALVLAWALSIVKWGSTMAHVTAKFSSLSYVRSNPRWYGLGSSWPSIHTWHGTILPENFFVQIMLDIGIPGMILRLLFWYMALKNIWTRVRTASRNDKYIVLLICLSFSFLGLLLEWMFLHVFEDSMVNYWFFILWGIVYGYMLPPHQEIISS